MLILPIKEDYESETETSRKPIKQDRQTGKTRLYVFLFALLLLVFFAVLIWIFF